MSNPLNFFSGGAQIDDVHGRVDYLRRTAALRVRAAAMVAAGDDPSSSTVGALLEDAGRLIDGIERAEKHMPTEFDLEARPTSANLADNATALRLALSGADFEDRRDREALDALAYGLELALEWIADRDALDGRRFLTDLATETRAKGLKRAKKRARKTVTAAA